MLRSNETAITRTILWRSPAEAPQNRPVLVAGGVAVRREDGWYSITGEEWPGRPIQWEVVAWAELPTGREAAEAAKLFDDEARELAASERISAALATYDDVVISFGPDDPEPDVHAFEAMKAALAKADAIRTTEVAQAVPCWDPSRYDQGECSFPACACKPPQTHVPHEEMSPEGQEALKSIVRAAQQSRDEP